MFLKTENTNFIIVFLISENNWMETVDLSSLISGPVKEAVEPVKSGRLLEELLTKPINIKSSPTVSASVQLDTIKSSSDTISKVQSTDLSLSLNSSNDDGLEALFLQQQLQELYDATISSGDMDIGELSTSSEISLISEDTEESLLDGSDEFIGSPLSSEDIDSILSSSGPSSPSDSIHITENDPDYSPYSPEIKSDKKSKKGRSSKASKSSTKSRTTPYEVEGGKLDKKERKRIQNRNAAIRYREKKRAQKGDIHTEEEDLSSKNKELKTKVEHLTNEIKYMKSLIVEVCQARGLKISFK